MSEISILLANLDQAFDRRSWHGPNLRGSIRGINAATAAWRPAPGRHNIWEIVVHAAYWKYAVLRKLRGDKRGSFPEKGSNWFARPASGAADETAWRKDVALLVAMHTQLRAAVAAISPKEMNANQPQRTKSRLWLITGIAAHDVYHAGQIQLLKRLARAER